MKDSIRSLFNIALAAAALPAAADTLVENFASNPSQTGWQVTGETSLFHWNSTNQVLEVTWDSSKTNTFFAHPLGTILTREDDFSFGFDLLLSDIGPADEFLWSFELAAGLLNLEQARQPGFIRGTGFDSPNLLEFGYFRADDFGTPATAYPTFVSTNSEFNYNPGQQNSTNFTITIGQWHRIEFAYTASNHTARLAITNLSDLTVAVLDQPLNESFTDFRVNAFSVSSYNDAGQFPGFEGSILAHGTLDNIAITVPPPPVQALVSTNFDGRIGVEFVSRTNWIYTLERSTNLNVWTDVSTETAGTGSGLFLEDLNADSNPSHAFYRVRAHRP